jgi:hypothetical protein
MIDSHLPFLVLDFITDIIQSSTPQLTDAPTQSSGKNLHSDNQTILL